MAAVLKQALPGDPAAAAPPWANPYAGGLDAATAAMNAPQAPMFTPEQVQDRQDANRRASKWGLLGVMMGDEGQQKAGGQVLQQALQARQERVTDKGVFNPLTGQMDINPEYAKQQLQTRQERLQDMAAHAQDTHENREDTQAFQQQQLAEQIAGRKEQAGLQREAMKANRQSATDQKNLTLSRQFNDDWQKVNKPDLDIRSSYQNLGALPSTPAGDISFIYNWMKAQDPGSTVRESEFSLAQNAASFGSKAQNYVNQIMHGTRLSPEQRAEMMGSAKSLSDQAENRVGKRNQYYDQQARAMGVDPGWVVPDYGRTTAELAARAAAQAGPPGAVAPQAPAPSDRRAGGGDRRGAVAAAAPAASGGWQVVKE